MNRTVVVVAVSLCGVFALAVGVQALLRDSPAPPAGAPAVAAPEPAAVVMSTPPAPVAADSGLSALLQREISAREQLERTVARLEKEITELKSQRPARTAAPAAPDTTARTAAAEPSPTPQTPEPVFDEAALREAGLSSTTVTQIRNRFEQLELDRLFLRDRAQREGWMGTVRYSNEVTKLEERRQDIRNSLGDTGYDAYLYATGQPNRVMIREALQESPAKLAGIQPGDVVLRYGEKRVFTTRELQNATAGGRAGENVLVEIERNGQKLDVYVPRGPLGVYLDADSVKP
jgi:hypothetical protein